MKTNPYESPAEPGVQQANRPAWKMLEVAALICAGASILAAWPALYLVNQELQIIPTQHVYYFCSIRGIPVSNTIIIGCSLTVAFGFAAMTAGLWQIAKTRDWQLEKVWAINGSDPFLPLPTSSAPAPNPPKP